MDQVQLEIKRGDSKSYTLYFRDEDNNVVDITDWTIYFTVKENINDDDADAKIKKTVTSHTNPTAGETQIELSITDTSLDIATYVFDIQYLDNLGNRKTVLEGIVIISKRVKQD